MQTRVAVTQEPDKKTPTEQPAASPGRILRRWRLPDDERAVLAAEYDVAAEEECP